MSGVEKREESIKGPFIEKKKKRFFSPKMDPIADVNTCITCAF